MRLLSFSHLRKYEPSSEEYGERTMLPNPRWTDDAEVEYQVERLVSHRRNRRRGQLEYLVCWEGYSPEHDEWLTARELCNAPARLLDYRRQHGL